MYRKAGPEDCADVYQLICQLEGVQLPYRAFSAAYRSQMDDSRYYCLVYELGGEIAGVLNLRFELQLHHAACIAEIMEFAVDAAHRQQGIGSKMFSEACRIAAERGCIQIEAASNQLRKEAHRFYTREDMSCLHLKFSKSLSRENAVGNRTDR